MGREEKYWGRVEEYWLMNEGLKKTELPDDGWRKTELISELAASFIDPYLGQKSPLLVDITSHEEPVDWFSKNYLLMLAYCLARGWTRPFLWSDFPY